MCLCLLNFGENRSAKTPVTMLNTPHMHSAAANDASTGNTMPVREVPMADPESTCTTDKFPTTALN